jgi:membrane carboxypeptidase/penicillin-binding protein
VGFSNEVTVAVWLGYDNAGGKRRTLGGGATGGGVAVPIFEPVMKAVWANVAPKTTLAPPSAEAKRQLSCRSSGDFDATQHSRRAITECFRVGRRAEIIDTQYRLISREGADARQLPEDGLRRVGTARAAAAPRQQWGWRSDYGQRVQAQPAWQGWFSPFGGW